MDEDEIQEQGPVLQEGAIEELNLVSESGGEEPTRQAIAEVYGLPEELQTLPQEARALPEETQTLSDLGSEQPQQEVQEARGVPHPEAVGITNQWRRAGAARVRALGSLFGTDALVLGHLIFQVPPLAIRVKKGNIIYRWKPLRTKESIAVKSGNGECFIEIDLAFVGVRQISESLGSLISLWKKIPFCPIENLHIRRMMLPEDSQAGQTMWVCLETLVMDAISGHPNTVYATLILRWFNYKPSSHNLMLRRDWIATGDTESIPAREERRGVIKEDDDGEIPAVDTNSLIGTSIVDLSALDAPTSIDTAQPPEARLDGSSRTRDPGDSDIAPTYPVVYGFNSRPFINRVTSGVDSARRTSTWDDFLAFNWRSFIRTRVPISWQIAYEHPELTQVSRPALRDRGSEAAPPPVTGDRDVVLLMGDSIMVGFTGTSSRRDGGEADTRLPGQGGPPWSTATFFQGTSQRHFPTQSGFTYYCSCRVGAGSSRLRTWWNSIKSRSELKHSGQADGSRLAGVVIHTGTNDGPNGPSVAHIQAIATEAAQMGANVVILPLPPSGRARLERPSGRVDERGLLRRPSPGRCLSAPGDGGPVRDRGDGTKPGRRHQRSRWHGHQAWRNLVRRDDGAPAAGGEHGSAGPSARRRAADGRGADRAVRPRGGRVPDPRGADVARGLREARGDGQTVKVRTNIDEILKFLS